MIDVAKQLDTKASTLYRHVNNKRELFFAMLIEEYRLFADSIDDLVSHMQDPTPNKVLIAICNYILEISRNDFERFKLMFLTKPPDVGGKGEDITPGPYEAACDPQTIGFIENLVEQHLVSLGFAEENMEFITYTVLSTIVGAGLVTSEYYNYLNADFLSDSQYEEFHKFIVSNSIAHFLK